MTKMFIAVTFSALLFVAFQAVSVMAQDAPAEIQNYVKSRGGKKNYPTEINKYLNGDLNDDGKEDAVVQYNVNEGAPGNYYTSYIAVFLNKGGKLMFASQTVSGTKLSGALVPTAIAGSKVAVDKYPANSIEKSGTVYYKLVGKKLVITK